MDTYAFLCYSGDYFGIFEKACIVIIKACIDLQNVPFLTINEETYVCALHFLYCVYSGVCPCFIFSLIILHMT